MELEFYLKSSTSKSHSNIRNNTEAICEWRLRYGKYMMNVTDWHLICDSTFCNQYKASVHYPYKHFVSFSLLYILRKHSIAFASFFSEAYCQHLVTQTSLWHHNGNQDVTKEAAVTMICGHTFQGGSFEAVLWAIVFVIVVSPRTFALGLWWASQVVGDTTILVLNWHPLPTPHFIFQGS